LEKEIPQPVQLRWLFCPFFLENKDEVFFLRFLLGVLLFIFLIYDCKGNKKITNEKKSVGEMKFDSWYYYSILNFEIEIPVGIYLKLKYCAK
jgi:hypothetical protein